MRNDIRLSPTTADAITVDNLKDIYAYVTDNLQLAKEGRAYLHPEDHVYNIELLEHIRFMLEYFGESL